MNDIVYITIRFDAIDFHKSQNFKPLFCIAHDDIENIQETHL